MNIQERLVEEYKERVEEARIKKTYIFPNAYVKLTGIEC